MARVTENEVREIITTRRTSLTTFINMAHNYLDARLAGSDLMSDDELKEIERWLSAHFIAVVDGEVKSEGLDALNESYVKVATEGLGSSMYGQQAVALDRTGLLAGKKVVSMDWLGRTSTYTGEN
jgi:hypothetical protein